MAEGLSALDVVDGLALPDAWRRVLRPGESIPDLRGRGRRLPRFFYEVPSWEVAAALQLTENFSLYELLDVDVREVMPQRAFPRYVPCAVTLLATALQRLRDAVGMRVYVAANGGYRSPAHRLNRGATPHMWGTAANLYRVGEDYLTSAERIQRLAEIAGEAIPGVWVRPVGTDPGEADDHLHLDLGYVLSVPRHLPEHTGTGEEPTP
jgi:hypothetical protein